MYLQANKSSKAKDFYTNLRFEKTTKNSTTELLDRLQVIYNNTTVQIFYFYLNFVTDDVYKKEAKSRAAKFQSSVNLDEFFHLYVLCRNINTIQYANKYDSETEELNFI